MSDLIRLARVGDMKIDRDKRTVHGTVMPYNEIALVQDPGSAPYKERFLPGSLTRTLDQRGMKIRLYGMHSRNKGGAPIGKPLDWQDGTDRLRGQFGLFDTSAGNDALILADPENGGFTGFSVGFSVRDGGTRMDGDIVSRTEAGLGEVSLVDIPAYAGATIDGLRMELDQLDDAEVGAWWELLPEATRAAFEAHVRSLDTEDTGTPDEAPPDTGHGELTIAEARLRLLTLKGTS